MTGSPLATLSDAPALLLAVSGGPDSTALLVMAAEWKAEREAPKLFASTVDHGLRPESASEAATVAALAMRLGVPHRTLVWEGEKPTSRLQERAREARYDLLAAEALAVGAPVIVTGHHQDDQAETVLFRLLRGSGIGGLAGMTARSQRGPMEIARPLLDWPKSELVAFCEARGLTYVRDASNADARFARPRLRILRDRLAHEGLDTAALLRLAHRAEVAEAALAAKAAEAETRLRLVAVGSCDARALAAEPLDIVRRLLSEAAAAQSGRYAVHVRLDVAERHAARLLEAIAASRVFSANFSGASVTLADGQVRISPEAPRRTPPPHSARAGRGDAD